MKKLGVWTLIIAALAVCLWLLTIFRLNQAVAVRTVSSQIENMERTINKFEMQKRHFEQDFGNFPQPVPPADVERLQNALIKQMTSTGLEIQGLTKKTDPPPPVTKNNGPKVFIPASVKYECVVLGPWSATMQYLNNLARDPSLILVYGIKMEADTMSNKVKTTFGYKIFKE